MATTSMSRVAAGLTSRQRFLFDLNGYIVLRGVFSKDEVDAVNAVIDGHLSEVKSRDDPALRNAPEADTPASGSGSGSGAGAGQDASAFSAPGPRKDVGGILWWKDGGFFRDVLAHPKLFPVLNEVLGDGYRLDHQPQLILQDRDSEGFSLHGGPLHGSADTPVFTPELQYRWVPPGKPWASLVAVSVVLSPHGPEDGGFCVVRGSHKLNLPMESDIASGRVPEFQEHVHQPVTEPGDVILFAEATIHGALPWRAAHQRRLALYRFSPPTGGYGRGHYEMTDDQRALLSPLQRAVVEPPYATRLERPTLTPDAVESGTPHVTPRSAAKKAFDKALFGTTFF